MSKIITRKALYQKLEQSINTVDSGLEFFANIITIIQFDSNYKSRILERNGYPIKVIFELNVDYTNKFAEIIFNHPQAVHYFSTVEELRIVNTNITKKQAKKFKLLNPSMKVYHVSSKEYLDRCIAVSENPHIREKCPEIHHSRVVHSKFTMEDMGFTPL